MSYVPWYHWYVKNCRNMLSSSAVYSIAQKVMSHCLRNNIKWRALPCGLLCYEYLKQIRAMCGLVISFWKRKCRIIAWKALFVREAVHSDNPKPFGSVLHGQQWQLEFPFHLHLGLQVLWQQQHPPQLHFQSMLFHLQGSPILALDSALMRWENRERCATWQLLWKSRLSLPHTNWFWLDAHLISGECFGKEILMKAKAIEYSSIQRCCKIYVVISKSKYWVKLLVTTVQ